MSLELDERQRAMLREMGVRVWSPPPQAAVAPVVAAVLAAAKVRREDKVQTPEKSARPGTEIQYPPHPSSEKLQAGNWPDLQHDVANCRACSLCEGRTQTVFGVGQKAVGEAPPQVDWLIVGEAPGENEDRVGEPFVGQAGQLLDNMLKAMKLSRQANVYIVNVIKCRPPGNRNPTPEEVAQCEPYLHRQIALLRPKIILAMGKFATASLLRATLPEVDKTPLGRLRGQVHTYAHGGLSIPVVATYHPAYLLRSLTEKAKAWADLCLALEHMQKAG